MWSYGQYCPMAHALEIIGERWTLLIIRDMMSGTKHFNDLERGLPGVSRGLLSERLQMLQRTGVVEKRTTLSGRHTTEYHLTEAGCALLGVVEAVAVWGAAYAFADPLPRELNSGLLIWWMYRGLRFENLPAERTVVQFDFHGEERASYWLVLECTDADLCLTDPGYGVDLWVSADLAAFFKVWAGRLTYQEALESNSVKIDGVPKYQRAFPSWLAWSAAAPDVRAAQANAAIASASRD
jgi:DNA-binding HxlR family transcriptional regulator